MVWCHHADAEFSDPKPLSTDLRTRARSNGFDSFAKQAKHSMRHGAVSPAWRCTIKPTPPAGAMPTRIAADDN